MAGLNTAQIKDRARSQGVNLSDSDAQSILEQAWDQTQYGADEGKVLSLLGGYGGGVSGTPTSADDAASKAIKELTDFFQKGQDLYKEFDTKNPFAFDEVLAKASAQESYNPYYEAELSDLVSGIERQRESTEGEQALLMDLNRIQSGAEKRNLEDAIRASEEGYSGAGLYFSGAKERGTGMQQIEGKEQATVREKQYGFNLSELGRRMEGLGAQETTGKRKIGAEKTTAIESSIANQKAEERARWETERQQYVGYPYNTSSGMNQLLQYM